VPCVLCNGVGMVPTPGDWRENGGWEICPMCHPSQPGFFRRLWHWFLARHRLDLNLVCELSKGRGLHDDFHDYDDDEYGQPWHFIELTCKRCGKRFCV
jgi:hypothetical protein